MILVGVGCKEQLQPRWYAVRAGSKYGSSAVLIQDAWKGWGTLTLGGVPCNFRPHKQGVQGVQSAAASLSLSARAMCSKCEGERRALLAFYGQRHC